MIIHGSLLSAFIARRQVVKEQKYFPLLEKTLTKIMNFVNQKNNKKTGNAFFTAGLIKIFNLKIKVRLGFYAKCFF